MARDTKKRLEENLTRIETQEEDTTENLYKIAHNISGGRIIVLRRNMQNYLNYLPEEERVSLCMVNKKGDDALYFTATQTRADRILGRFEKQAKDWSYVGANFKMEIVEEEPEKIMSAEDLERLEDKIGESYKEELGRLHVQIGVLTAELTHSKDDFTEMEDRAVAAEDLHASVSDRVDQFKKTIESLNTLKETLAKGTLADACISFIHARSENVEMLELLLADIKESGLDVQFIANPPESVERYAKEKLMSKLKIEYQDLERCLEIGQADNWEDSRLHMPKTEMNDATDKLTKLTQTISSAPESIKSILEENLRDILGKFNATVREYTSKQDRYQQARQTYLAHKDAIEQGTDELAKAKQLKVSLSDLRKMKFPLYSVPEQDGATVHIPSVSGIAYDSLIEAVNQHAQVKSEEEISGNTVLRIGGTNGVWNPVRVFRAIKETYEKDTEAGKIGSKLGLLVQF